MCSATSHLGGKMTKSSKATPGFSVGAVSTALKWQGSKIRAIFNNPILRKDRQEKRNSSQPVFIEGSP